MRWGSCFHLQAADFLGYVQLQRAEGAAPALAVSTSLLRSDAFRLEAAPEMHMRLLHKVQSVRSLLHSYLPLLDAHVAAPPVGGLATHRHVRAVLAGAEEMFAAADGEGAVWAELVREAELLDLVGDVARDVAGPATAAAAQRGIDMRLEVFRAAHSLLHAAIAAQACNGEFLASRVPEWQAQLLVPCLEPDVSRTLQAMLSDNVEVVRALPPRRALPPPPLCPFRRPPVPGARGGECGRVTAGRAVARGGGSVLEQFIRQAVDAADEISRAANLRFIASLVAVQQEGVRTNQEAVVDAMLRGAAPLFPKILVGEREGIDVALPLAGPAGARVAAAARGNGEDARARAPAVALRVLYRDAPAHGGELAVLEAALRLLTALCAGCDPDTRALVGGPHRLVSFDALLLGIEDRHLPPRARAQLARLMQALFVGRPPADQLPARLSTHLLHEADLGQLQLPGPPPPLPPPLLFSLRLTLLYSPPSSSSRPGVRGSQAVPRLQASARGRCPRARRRQARRPRGGARAAAGGGGGAQAGRTR